MDASVPYIVASLRSSWISNKSNAFFYGDYKSYYFQLYKSLLILSLKGYESAPFIVSNIPNNVIYLVISIISSKIS